MHIIPDIPVVVKKKPPKNVYSQDLKDINIYNSDYIDVSLLNKKYMIKYMLIY